MNDHNGLTIIPHEDLCRAVNSWQKLCKLYKERRKKADDYANTTYDSQPFLKRCWQQLKSGIFTPNEYFKFHEEYLKATPKIKGYGKGKHWIPERCYCTQAMAAEDCHQHSLENGTHYLTPDQVEFVHVFKDLEVGYD